jgi:hypothetical protein
LDAFKALKSLIESDTSSGEDVGVCYLPLPRLCKSNYLGCDDCEHTL